MGPAIIIPPSALAVLLATLAQIDVGALPITGIIPGLIPACLYIGMIWFRTKRDPDAAPAYEITPMPLSEWLWLILRDVVAMLLVMMKWVAPPDTTMREI